MNKLGLTHKQMIDFKVQFEWTVDLSVWNE